MSARASAVRKSDAVEQAPLKVVTRRKRKLVKREGGRRLAPVAILLALAASAVIIGVLLEQVLVAQSAFELKRVHNQLLAAEEMHEELLLESAKLESPARIEAMATQMGMVTPSSVKYIVADIPTSKRSRLIARGNRPTVPADAAAVAVEAGP